MAANKRQRTLAGFYQRALEPTLELVHVVNAQSSSNSNSSSANNKVTAARLLWKEKWLQDYDWLKFNNELGVMYCSICKECGGKGAFATLGSTNFKASVLHDHANTGEHKKLAWAVQSGSKRMEKIVAEATITCDEALMSLFKTAYYVGKELIPFSKFTPLCQLLLSVNATITDKLYHDDKACADMVVSISSVLQRKLLDRVRDSQFFGIMIDESTDISVLGHLVVFATFLEDGVPVCGFLGLLHILGGKKDAGIIYDLLLTCFNQWGLDLDRFVGFGSDGAVVMIGNCNGVAARLKSKVNPFLFSIHCVAHRTNLASLDAAKSVACKSLSTLLDTLINDTATHFKRSSKAKCKLAELQVELNYAQKSLKRYQKIRWFSRW